MPEFKRKPIEGLFPLMPFCLKENQEVDYDAIRFNIEFLEKKGIPGFIQFGCMGQMNAPSEEEFNKVCDVAVDACKGKKIACVMSSTSTNTKEAIRRAKYAEDAGADGSMLMLPYAFPVLADWAVKFYQMVDEALNGELAIILYNIPMVSGFNVSPALWRNHLLKIESLKAIKDSNFAIPHHDESILTVADKVNWFSGTDPNFWFDSQLGGKGIIGIMAWVAPKVFNKWYHECRKGKHHDPWVLDVYKKIVMAWGVIRTGMGVVAPDAYMPYEHGRLNLLAEIGGAKGGPPRYPYERYPKAAQDAIREATRPLVEMKKEMG